MSKTRHPRRSTAVSTTVRRRLGLVGFSFVFLAGAAACKPVPLVLSSAPGKVAVTVTHDGKPVDAQLFLTTSGSFRWVSTGSDGRVTVRLAPGKWRVGASAAGEALPNDPLCFHSLEAGPKQVRVVSKRTASLTLELEAGPVVCQ